MTHHYRIAVIAGDGIGKEVMPEGIRAMEAAGERFDIGFDWNEFDWGCETYHRSGHMMPEDGIERLSEFDAIYLGAVGYPGVPDHISLWGLLIPIRRRFDQYVNLRPCKLMTGVPSPLRADLAQGVDFLVVRENTEGEYSDVGGRILEGTDSEAVIQQTVMTRHGTDRILRYAFELAQTRDRRKVTSATKSNGIMFTMPFWDERFRAMAEQYPDTEIDQYHIDILTAWFVRDPRRFDVVVGSNLFGDILSDLGPAVCGSIGIAPSANINPEGVFPSMFEPVHGSAPDIAGQGIANPIGQIWAGAMMLSHLGQPEAGAAVERAIESVLAGGGPTTADLGGKANTTEAGLAIAEAIRTA